MSNHVSEPAPKQWPSLEWERQVWLPTSGWSVNAEFEGGRQPYKSSIPPAIAALTPEPDIEAREAAEAAVQELSRFDAELGARVAGFAPVLLRSEAASSSQIENLTASARAIFSAELGSTSSRNAELIAANTRAMQAAIDLSDALSPAAILEMHRVLMGDQTRHTPGEWRREAVWIGTKSNSPIGAEFVAPHFERVPALVDDVVDFSARRDVPALISTAIAQAQFETIHPFTDGNGRTGRVFAQALLRHRGVTRNVAVPVSAGLLADVEGYHHALTAYREGNVSPIVLAFAEASLRAVANSRELVADIDAIKESWQGRLTARRSSNAWALLDVIARRPVIDSATAAAALGVKQPNVYPALQALTEAGILKSKAEHRAGPFWRSDEILGAIDRFAERAGRRERS
ncbi:Fic family protein [Herbiconiux sp. YIM B11900]|uniref:Fic family protein n=1 Tax=Herbiconiux sp. YIM B11900 TaxID=3404131 RepID=UPI003F87108A